MWIDQKGIIIIDEPIGSSVMKIATPNGSGLKFYEELFELEYADGNYTCNQQSALGTNILSACFLYFKPNKNKFCMYF